MFLSPSSNQIIKTLTRDSLAYCFEGQKCKILPFNIPTLPWGHKVILNLNV